MRGLIYISSKLPSAWEWLTQAVRERSGSQLTDGSGRDMNTGKMKSKIQTKTESPINRSNNTNNTFGFSHPRTQKLRRATVMFGAAIGALLLVTPAMSGDHRDHAAVEHVLLVSVDGMHQYDLALYA